VSGSREPRHLSRNAGDGRPAPPVTLVHLGLGNFFRAHQAWYTDSAPDATDWGIAAFTGRSPALSDALTPQDGLYTLVTRDADGDRFDVISNVARAHAAAEHQSWLDYFASPNVKAVTLTVTEAGYMRAADGGLDRDRDDVRADIDTLRADPSSPVRTAPAKLLAGLLARSRADAGRLSIVPCDNLPDNGAAVSRVVGELAEMVDSSVLPWLEDAVAYVTTMVDRITPKTTADDVRTVAEVTGMHDRAPVVTEPFSEWVLSGSFAAGRPAWEQSGATFTDDITPFEHRKLWLLNGGHSLLAYTGLIRGHETVAQAVADDTCRSWLQQWWKEASTLLPLPAADVSAYREALLERFSNPRMRHRLDQIAADGSQKLPVRILPTLRRERAENRMPDGAIRVLAAWMCHLRGAGGKVTDARADELEPLAAGSLPAAVAQVLGAVDSELATDGEVVAAVRSAAEEQATS
jgi:fructuronate reductase